jgi:outer membrane lipoprotein-sorting protein
MKIPTLFLLLSSFVFSASGQQAQDISFANDSKEVYHLSLIIYTPDGKIQTRVSDLAPNQIKTYSLPVATEIFVADGKQEAFAMKGNDIKATGVKPYLVLKESDAKRVIKTSSIAQKADY